MPCLLCDKAAVSRGLCMAHYQAARRAGTLNDVTPPPRQGGRPRGASARTSDVMRARWADPAQRAILEEATRKGRERKARETQ